MIQPTRVRTLNDRPIAEESQYVLYWMQASQRTRFNHALEYAIDRANELAKPLLVGFGLMDNYPSANARHYAFMLEGLCDVKVNLASRGINFVLKRGEPAEVALRLAGRAAVVVCDRGYTRHQKRWRDELADRTDRRVVQVESDVVVPADEVSDKAEFAARTIRPRIHRLWGQYLIPLRPRKVSNRGKVKVASDLKLDDCSRDLARLKVDRSVKPSVFFRGGEEAAAKMLDVFIREKLRGYKENRNEPSIDATTRLSAYLHFGQISPLEIALAAKTARGAPAPDRDALLEELIVRRELAVNHVHYNPRYDQYAGLPQWAQKTLREHRRDKRPAIYSRDQLESARTADPLWNAAQLEMLATGYMHNYMRMYWGKKVLEWKATAEEAFDDLLYLNDKYFLCGRDPNGYANVGWIFGLHDRPWGERKVFGKIRYMNAGGLRRKFDMDAYVKWVEQDLRPKA